ncbi:MAG: hypothetical protein QXP31_10755 [Pyrobaculum sp.]
MIPRPMEEFAKSLAGQVARLAAGASVEEVLYYAYLCTVGVLNDEMEKVEVVNTGRGVKKRLPPPEPIAEEVLMCIGESLRRRRPVVEKYDYYAYAP